MSYHLLNTVTIVSQIYFQLQFYQNHLCETVISLSVAELLLLLVSENKRPPYWKSNSSLQSGHIVAFGDAL